uniref:Ribonuclease A-domain domain-containing protein n=1 Tax=Leptobrachium leishanense TaxID=445787 RepID=A0A8C5QVZ0_9ANUR
NLDIVIILGIILCFSVLSQCQNVKSFMEKHIVQDNAEIICNDTIRNRNLRNRDGCRPRNTFIHDTNGHRIKGLCANIIESTVIISDMSFKLTDCKMQKGTQRPPNCAYKQKGETGKIHITCERNNPVHFVTFDVSFGVSWSPSILFVVALILLRELLTLVILT